MDDYDDAEPELTATEREYNIAASTLFGDAADGHYKHVTAGLDGDRAYRHLLRADLERFEAAVLRKAATAVLADTAHIRYGSATDYAQRHAALLQTMAADANPA